jgi:hypothetical protein
MKLWLSRSWAGWYFLTLVKPVIANVRFTKHKDLFDRRGEPLSIRHLCAEWVHTVLKRELKPLESIRIKMTIEVLT